MINKQKLIRQIIETLEQVYQDAYAAAMRAYETATDEENEAENKYDTLGLEASYLAQGQSKRVNECEADLNAFKKLNNIALADSEFITIGSIIDLLDESGFELILFLGPAAGGLKINYENSLITIITPSSPLGKKLNKRHIDDEIEIVVNNDKKNYVIRNIS